MAITPSSTAGVSVTLLELINLQYKAKGFSFLPHQPVKSLLAGRYGSKLRGRGLNFEEIRQYRPGDDIRNMDWKVTARTGKPHTRVYTEERDRPVIAIVDQRTSMFFGSQVNMKSVTAAQLGALAVWKAVHDGDRAGAVIFNDTDIEHIKPHRSKKNVTRILSVMANFNTALATRKAGDDASAPSMLNTVLKQLSVQATHDYLFAVISDYDGLTQETYRLVKQLSRKNDVLLCLVHDPLAMNVPAEGIIRVTDGGRSIELNTRSSRIREKLPQILKGRIEQLMQELSKFGVPTLPFNTIDDAADQVRALLGQRVLKNG